jgi:hypothetical protein
MKRAGFFLRIPNTRKSFFSAFPKEKKRKRENFVFSILSWDIPTPNKEKR